MSHVLDLSQYDLDTLDAPCLASSGVTGVILGVFHPSGPQPMRSAATKLQAAGVEVLGWYGLPYFGSPFGEQRDIGWAIQNALDFSVERVWIDCEIDAAAIGFTDDVGATPARRVAVIHDLVSKIEGAGLLAGIYSGGWWWPGQTGNSQDFAHLPLWHAAYPNDGSAIRTVNYGGWTDVAIHQYTSTLYLCGRGRDANYVFMEEDMGLSKDDIVALFGSTERYPKGHPQEGQLMTVEERYEFAKPRYEQARDSGVSLLEQVGGANAKLKEHTDNHAAGVSGPVAPHTHKPGGVA